jgi:formiminotetrahydrofolate cyclodeaminase
LHLTEALVDYVEAAAAREPTPGGGSVSALVGALGAALAEMACAFTVLDERGRLRDVEGAVEIKRGLARLRRVRESLMPLLESDCEAYQKVAAAQKLPRKTAGQKKLRAEHVQVALRGALEVPLQCARICVEGLDALNLMAASLNPNLATDTASGALFLAACFRGSWYNVRVNLKYIKDDALRSRVIAEGGELIARADELERLIRDRAEKSLG